MASINITKLVFSWEFGFFQCLIMIFFWSLIENKTTKDKK